MKKLYLFFISLFPLLIYGQTFQGYFDAASNSVSGFSYNVTLTVTALEYNSSLHVQGYKVRLASVSPDSRGYYDNFSGNYYTCGQLGSVCNPHHFQRAFVEIGYVCDNSGSQNVSFNNVGDERLIQMRLAPGSRCNLSLQKANVFTDTERYRTRLAELNTPKQTSNSTGTNNQNTGTSNTTNNSSNTSNNSSYSNSSSTNLNSTGSSNYQPTQPTQSSADIVAQGITTVGGMIGNWVEENRENRARREAEERERQEAERQRLIKIDNRNAAIKNIKEAEMPLSLTNVGSKTIYYFFISYDSSRANYDYHTINLSNVFPVERYVDDTWPSKVTIDNEIAGLTSRREVLIGWFVNKYDAETYRNNIINNYTLYGGSVKEFYYKGKTNADQSPSAVDFWESEKKETQTQTDTPSQTKTKQDSFWDE